QLMRRPPRLESLLSALHPDFCISRSYFISHHHKALLDSIDGGITLATPVPPPSSTDAWHPDDALLVPLISPRDERLLGILSLDQPEDGKIPTLETIEMIELFASLAALAIDTSRLFQEREQERQTLREGLFDLLFQMEQVRQGNLSVRPQLSGNILLDPITESLNATLVTLNNVLAEVRGASEMVNLSAAEMRAAAVELAEGAQQQAEQMLGVSQTIEAMARNVRGIAEMADTSNAEAQGASEISHEGRDAAALAAEGMSRVREMTLQTAKKVKRLGESSQEIGAIVQMVADFTSQTNLLALNAAIEAARAGENGRGFAIVAQEIRNLASSSAEATRQIHARIQSVQNETSQVVAQIEHTTQQVVLQSEYAVAAGSALEAVDASTQSIAAEIDRMRALATEQSVAATQLAQAMASLANSATQTRDTMDQTRASMEYLVELAVALLRKIGMFHLDIDTVTPAATFLPGDPLNGLLGAPTEPLGSPFTPPPAQFPGQSGQRPTPSRPSASQHSPVAPPSANAPGALRTPRPVRWQTPTGPLPPQSPQAPQATRWDSDPPTGWLKPLTPADEAAARSVTPPAAFRSDSSYPAPTPRMAPVTAPIPAIDPFAPLVSPASPAATDNAASMAASMEERLEQTTPLRTPTKPDEAHASPTEEPPLTREASHQAETNEAELAHTTTPLATAGVSGEEETASAETHTAPAEPSAIEAQETQPMPSVALPGFVGQSQGTSPVRRMTMPLPLSALIPPDVSGDQSVAESESATPADSSQSEAPADLWASESPISGEPADADTLPDASSAGEQADDAAMEA
ncbi:MAG TPA: methyl-accepting chemotaxis protein, partial [Ktedonobacterales bacterium]|nr:methyl-accepting chemotaxis protein [Ktedonobacterales bacterium]